MDFIMGGGGGGVLRSHSSGRFSFSRTNKEYLQGENQDIQLQESVAIDIIGGGSLAPGVITVKMWLSRC